MPIDLLGGGVAVAAPSRAPRGFYQIIQGSLADLDRLPRIKAVDDLTRHNDNTSPKAASPESIAYGQRNAALFNFCLAEARDCGSSDELLERATAFAHTVLSPVPKPVSAGEIRDTAMSAWRIEQRGDNMVGSGRCVMLKHDFMDRYLDASGPGHDALILVATLKRHHWGRDHFALAKTMAPKLGWRPTRFYKARQRLIDDSVIRRIHPGGRGPSDPALYAWVDRNRKPRPAGDGI